MSGQLTLGKARNSRLPLPVNLCPSDPRVVDIINEAQEALLDRGDFLRTDYKALFCLTEDCITWPRQVEAIRGVRICKTSIPIRNAWYEFLLYPTGSTNNPCSCDGQLQLEDVGYSALSSDIVGANKALRIYPDNANDIGKTITFKGYNENGTWILSDNGAIEGEVVTIALPYAETVNLFDGGVTGVNKDVTLGNIRVYELDTTNSSIRQIATYEPDETAPLYRRSKIRGLANLVTQTNCGNPIKVEAMVKLSFIAAVNDNDFLMIQCPQALKYAVQAVIKDEDNLPGEAEVYWAKAIRALNMQLRNTTSPPSVNVSVHGSAYLRNQRIGTMV